MKPNSILKGSLNAIILKLLSERERMYGYEMTRAVREITNNRMQITEAALYPTLHKLVAEGLLETVTEMVNGRARKYYSLSQKGAKEGAKKVDAIREALESVQLILTKKPSYG
jgi:PadR family transcriptional regulator PadR